MTGSYLLVETLALGGVADAVAVDVENAVGDVLTDIPDILNIQVLLQLAVDNLQLFIIYSLRHDADAPGVQRYFTAEETAISTDGGSCVQVRVINRVVLQTEIDIVVRRALQLACAQ